MSSEEHQEQMSSEGVILLQDILSDVDVLTQKEGRDRLALEAIQWISAETLRPSLVQWAIAGFPNAWSIHTIPVELPRFCSDGVKRTLSEYVVFLTGKPMHELIAPIQARLPDIQVSFLTTGPTIQVVVLKYPDQTL